MGTGNLIGSDKNVPRLIYGDLVTYLKINELYI